MDPRRSIYPQRVQTQNSELRTQDSGLRTQDAELRTHNSVLRTQDSGLRTQDSGLRPLDSGLRSVRFFTRRGFYITCNVRDADQDGGAAAWSSVSIAGLNMSIACLVCL